MLLFHAGLGAFRHGYVGVSVFFVISGYLFASMVVTRIERGEFDYFGYLHRRLSRLYPMLMVGILFAALVGYLLIIPRHLEDASRVLALSAVFLTNFYYVREFDYFDQVASGDPAIHFWSIAVEMQFYVFVPLILLAFRRRLGVALWALFVLSIVSGFILDRHAPAENYYVTSSRVWEFLAGALAARYVLKGLRSQIAVMIGALLICLSLVDYGSPIASLNIYIAVLGTVLLLLGPHHWMRVPMGSVVILLGASTYAVYILHQPLFVGFGLVLNDWTDKLLLPAIAIVFLSGIAAHLFIERPLYFNRGPLSRKSRKRWLIGSACAVCAVGFGILGDATDGFAYRTSVLSDTSFAEVDQRLARNYGLSANCNDLTMLPSCSTGANPTVALWGDSFAMHLANWLVASPTDIDFVQITRSACAPVVGVAQVIDGRDVQACMNANLANANWLMHNPDIETIILASPFDLIISDIQTAEAFFASGSSEQIVRQAISDTVAMLRDAGKRVVLVGPTPSNGRDLGACLGQSLLSGRASERCNVLVDAIEGKVSAIYDALSQLEGVPVIELPTILCSPEECLASLGEKILYNDDSHLSVEGSTALGDFFDLAGTAVSVAR